MAKHREAKAVARLVHYRGWKGVRMTLLVEEPGLTQVTPLPRTEAPVIWEASLDPSMLKEAANFVTRHVLEKDALLLKARWYLGNGPSDGDRGRLA
jgi:hypothetical protein